MRIPTLSILTARTYLRVHNRIPAGYHSIGQFQGRTRQEANSVQWYTNAPRKGIVWGNSNDYILLAC